MTQYQKQRVAEQRNAYERDRAQTADREFVASIDSLAKCKVDSAVYDVRCGRDAGYRDAI